MPRGCQPPLGEHVVGDEGGFAGGLGVAELLARAETAAPAADVDGVELGVVGEADGGEVRHAVRADGAEAAQALSAEVGDLLLGEVRHGVGMAPMCRLCGCSVLFLLYR